MNLQDLLAPDEIGVRHLNLAIEPARTHQGRVEHVGTVGRGDQDDAFIGLEAVHLDQQLVERLLALVIAAAEPGAAMTAHRVDFVDEDDAGRVLLGLLEHVAHARGADADEHFDEIGARDGEERHIGLAGDGARQQGLAGAGRADQQHAARNAPAEPLEFLRIAQKFDDLLEVFLGLVDAGDILERHPPLQLREQLGLRLAKPHRPTRAALHLPRQENPHAEEGDQRQAVEQQRHHPAIAVAERLGADLHVLALQALHQRRIVRRIGLEGAIVGEMAGDLVAGDRHVMHAALVDLGQQFAEGDVANWRALSRLLEEHDERHDQQADDCP